MADVYNMAVKVRRERISDFASHSGDIYILGFSAEDKSIQPVIIYANGVTASHFNAYDDGTAVPNGSLLIDTADSGKMYLKQGATTWTEIGDVT